MAKRTDTRLILVIAVALAIGACGERVSRSETTSPDELVGDAADCVERFAGGSKSWGERPVRASFFYDVASLGKKANLTFLGKGDPADDGAHRTVIAMDDAGSALEDFLSSSDHSDTAFFRSGDVLLFRVNDGPAPYSDVLRTGCARLREGVSIRQVTFEQGNI